MHYLSSKSLTQYQVALALLKKVSIVKIRTRTSKHFLFYSHITLSRSSNTVILSLTGYPASKKYIWHKSYPWLFFLFTPYLKLVNLISNCVSALLISCVIQNLRHSKFWHFLVLNFDACHGYINFEFTHLNPATREAVLVFCIVGSKLVKGKYVLNRRNQIQEWYRFYDWSNILCFWAKSGSHSFSVIFTWIVYATYVVLPES